MDALLKNSIDTVMKYRRGRNWITREEVIEHVGSIGLAALVAAGELTLIDEGKNYRVRYLINGVI